MSSGRPAKAVQIRRVVIVSVEGYGVSGLGTLRQRVGGMSESAAGWADGQRGQGTRCSRMQSVPKRRRSSVVSRQFGGFAMIGGGGLARLAAARAGEEAGRGTVSSALSTALRRSHFFFSIASLRCEMNPSEPHAAAVVGCLSRPIRCRPWPKLSPAEDSLLCVKCRCKTAMDLSLLF